MASIYANCNRAQNSFFRLPESVRRIADVILCNNKTAVNHCSRMVRYPATMPWKAARRCPYCGGLDVHRSTPRGAFEWIVIPSLLCYRIVTCT